MSGTNSSVILFNNGVAVKSNLLTFVVDNACINVYVLIIDGSLYSWTSSIITW